MVDMVNNNRDSIYQVKSQLISVSKMINSECWRYIQHPAQLAASGQHSEELFSAYLYRFPITFQCSS